ncbi:hypothetical protein PsYK624_145230 [Phanerochaete sordida]|uniref:Uncharacterized protein n=1 Tax=Phanerochaete sordida TaxID=48140 RepID=A0A9P3GMT1_9APHY|nr:hypothetical protein PsYK624_145230 [Phanerochaete sordida]
MNIINLVGVLTWETKILGLTPMIVYLPPILISRFLLNLRDCTNVCPGGASLQTLSSPGIKLAAQSVLGNIGAPLGCPRDDELSYATDSDAQDENGGVDDLLADATGADPEVCNGAYVARRRAVEGTPDGLSQGFSAKVHKAQEPV